MIWITNRSNSGDDPTKVSGWVFLQLRAKLPLNPMVKPWQMYNRVVVGLHDEFGLWTEGLLPMQCCQPLESDC